MNETNYGKWSKSEDFGTEQHRVRNMAIFHSKMAAALRKYGRTEDAETAERFAAHNAEKLSKCTKSDA